MNVLLVLSYHGVARSEEFQCFFFLLRKVIPLEVFEQVCQQSFGLYVLREIIGSNGEIVNQVGGCLTDGFGQDFVEEQQVFDAFGVSQDSLLVQRMVEVEFALVLGEVGPQILLSGVLIEPAKVGGDAGVESADDVVEYLFLCAHLLVGVLEAVLLVDEFPDVGAIIVGKGLDIGVYVEVLSLVVGLVLDVPDPAVLCVASFVLPKVLIMEVRLDLLRVGPEFWNVLVVASAHCATLALADFVHSAQLALLVYVQSDYTEVFGLHQLAQRG